MAEIRLGLRLELEPGPDLNLPSKKCREARYLPKMGDSGLQAIIIIIIIATLLQTLRRQARVVMLP